MLCFLVNEVIPMKGYLIKVPDDLWKQVKSLAALQGISIKTLIEQLLNGWIEKKGKK